jgi:hypothetical protein
MNIKIYKTLAILSITCVLLGAAIPRTVSAEAEVSIWNGHESLDLTIWNECTEEIVHLTGRINWTSHSVIDTDGGGHVVTNVSQTLSGVSDSGIFYRLIQHEVQTFNGDGEDHVPYVYSIPFTSIFKASGDAPDMKLNVIWHLTLFQDGTVASFINEWHATCV